MPVRVRLAVFSYLEDIQDKRIVVSFSFIFFASSSMGEPWFRNNNTSSGFVTLIEVWVLVGDSPFLGVINMKQINIRTKEELNYYTRHDIGVLSFWIESFDPGNDPYSRPFYVLKVYHDCGMAYSRKEDQFDLRYKRGKVIVSRFSDNNEGFDATFIAQAIAHEIYDRGSSLSWSLQKYDMVGIYYNIPRDSLRIVNEENRHFIHEISDLDEIERYFSEFDEK